MTPGGSITRLRWSRVEGPAIHYEAEGGRYEIIWDPEGWHAWQGTECLGILPTLREAKALVEEIR
jgi:hypothetical protein